MNAVRVVQTTAFMNDIKAEVLKGHLAPASFQRPYVWSEADVEAMWDSIRMGLPLGSFLLWSPPHAVRTSRQLGPIRIDPTARATLILDGQNRLATLAWSMTDPSDPDIPDSAEGGMIWRSGRRLVADANERIVRFADASELEDPWILPMSDCGDRLMKTLRLVWRKTEDDPAKSEWLDDLDRMTRQARVVVTTIHADEAHAKAAFARMSRAGVPMSESDFEAAMKGSRHDA